MENFSLPSDFIRKMQLLLNSEWEDFKTCYENNKYQGNNYSNDNRVWLAENILAFEKPRHGVHGILADENTGYKRHMPPHKESQQQAGSRLQEIQPCGHVL